MVDRQAIEEAISKTLESLGGGIVLAFVAGEHQHADVRAFDPLLSEACCILCDISERDSSADHKTPQTVPFWARYHCKQHILKSLLGDRKIAVLLDFTGAASILTNVWDERVYKNGILVQMSGGFVTRGKADNPEHFENEPFGLEDLGIVERDG